MAKQKRKRSIGGSLAAGLALTAVLLVLAFLLIGCGGGAGTETAVTEPPAEPAAGVEVAMALEEETSAGVETAVALTATMPITITDECLICHLDKETLIQTADPVEEVVSENEGEG